MRGFSFNETCCTPLAVVQCVLRYCLSWNGRIQLCQVDRHVSSSAVVVVLACSGYECCVVAWRWSCLLVLIISLVKVDQKFWFQLWTTVHEWIEFITSTQRHILAGVTKATPTNGNRCRSCVKQSQDKGDSHRHLKRLGLCRCWCFDVKIQFPLSSTKCTKRQHLDLK